MKAARKLNTGDRVSISEARKLQRQIKIKKWEDMLAEMLDQESIKYYREIKPFFARKFRWDFAIHTTGSSSILIEVHGQIWKKGGHSSGGGITRDAEKLNAAVLAGYRPLVFTPEHIKSGYAILTILKAIGRE